MSNATYKDVRAGDRYTFLNNDSSFYTALSDPVPGAFTITAALTYFGKTNPPQSYFVSSPDEPCTILNRNLNEGEQVKTEEAANGAKLELAYDWDLSAKFTYTNEDGETRERRLKVEDFDGEYVEGQSFDEHGRHEGYRRFLIDRIKGPVVIR